MEFVNNGNWRFEHNKSKLTYRIDAETIDDRCFKYEETELFDNADNDFKKAALVHKIVRNSVRGILKENTKIKDIVAHVEDMVLKLYKRDRNTYFKQTTIDGLAFPVGVSINNVAAHDSALLDDDRCLERGDVVKIDFGVHQNGHIIDSAFTHVVGFDDSDSEYENLLEASRDATYSAIAMSGPDTRLLELSEVISEIISSYELPLDSYVKNKQIVPVEGLGGHDILPYRIHGDKLILSVPNQAQEGMKMEEGEIYAIETYASTGAGILSQSGSADECSHFMLNPNVKSKRFFKKSDAYKGIKHRNGLPFTLQWCDTSYDKFVRDFKQAILSNDILAYPPLVDEPHARISQFEHTIRIRDGSVTIYSKGDDY